MPISLADLLSTVIPLSSALIRPSLLSGGGIEGVGPLDSHDYEG